MYDHAAGLQVRIRAWWEAVCRAMYPACVWSNGSWPQWDICTHLPHLAKIDLYDLIRGIDAGFHEGAPFDIDLGKTTFDLIGMDERGYVVLRRRFSRMQLITYISKLDTCLIGMEDLQRFQYPGANPKSPRPHCSAHLLLSSLRQTSVKSNKNDYNYAVIIADCRPETLQRFVPIKTEDQLFLQAIHRTRSACMTGTWA